MRQDADLSTSQTHTAPSDMPPNTNPRQVHNPTGVINNHKSHTHPELKDWSQASLRRYHRRHRGQRQKRVYHHLATRLTNIFKRASQTPFVKSVQIFDNIVIDGKILRKRTFDLWLKRFILKHLFLASISRGARVPQQLRCRVGHANGGTTIGTVT